MGRLTEIVCSTNSKEMPTKENTFHIDVGHEPARKELKQMRKIFKRRKKDVKGQNPLF